MGNLVLCRKRSGQGPKHSLEFRLHQSLETGSFSSKPSNSNLLNLVLPADDYITLFDRLPRIKPFTIRVLTVTTLLSRLPHPAVAASYIVSECLFVIRFFYGFLYAIFTS